MFAAALSCGQRERLLSLRGVGSSEQITDAAVVRRGRDAFDQRGLRERIETVVLVIDS